MSRKDQIIKATETKEIFSQLAESLGMWEVKKELDDLSLSYLQPKNYKLTSQEIRKDPRVTFYYKKIIQNIEAIIPKSLKSEINFIINSVSAVELKKNKNLEQGITSKPDIFYVNDVVSIRVLTKNINDCYRILGMIESHFAPLIDESRFDNFLLRPALNGYSALQTTINTEYGALEIAITTEDRENFNKHGILVYLRNNDIKMLDKFRLKVVFSANGKAYYLPKDALVLDLIFLYPSLFSGSKLIKVNGKKIDPLEKIPGGSIFKVYGNQKDVKVDFKKAIKICLPSTVASIRKASHVLLRDQKRTSGRKILNRLLKSRGVLELDDLPELRDQFVTYFQTHSSSNLYLSVGLGAINNSDIINFLDRNNFNKTAFLYTSMMVTGKNKPGVLAQITESISRLGGDIRSLNQNVQKGRFNMRFLIYGLDRDAEQKLSTKMKNSKLFTRLVIV